MVDIYLRLVQFMQNQCMKMTNRKSKIAAGVPLLTTLTLLTSLAVHPAIAADTGIYKTIGADGSIVFTDKPQQNTSIARSRSAEPVANSQPTPARRSDEFSSDTLGGLQNRKINISAVQIISPRNNQTLSAAQDSILIKIAMGPDKALPEGHTALVRMNGNIVANKSRTEANVPAPVRGTHIFDVQIINSNGKILVKSEPITVYVN